MKMPPLKVNHSMKASFEWVIPQSLTEEEINSIGLIKGVALTEGKVKTGELYSKENVIAGAGGMRATAIMGECKLSIDHIHEKLPKEYEEKYGKEINHNYPEDFGFVVDAKAVEIDGKHRVEFIGVVNNKKAYDLIKAGNFVGCSVEDLTRGLRCDDDNCSYDGNAFMHNTLVLDSVPNSNETWVSAVTEKDVGTILTIPDKANNNNSKIKKIIMKKLTAQNSLQDYMKDGIWNEGEKSIIEFLTSVKEMDESLAKDIAKTIHKTPNLLSQFQLDGLSKEDLTAWYLTLTLQTFQSQLNQLQRNQTTVNWLLKDDIQYYNSVKPKNNAVRYGQGEVNYGERPAGEQCKDCRWFMQHNTEDAEGPGECIVVTDDVRGTGGCDLFDRNPTIPEQEEETPEEEGEEMPTEEMPPQEEMSSAPQPTPVPEHTHHAVKEPNPVNVDHSKIDAKIEALEKAQHSITFDPRNRVQAEEAMSQYNQLQSEINMLKKKKKGGRGCSC